MVKKTYVGKVVNLKLKEGIFLTIELPHKPDKASMNLHVGSIFEEYLDKMVKVTIEDVDDYSHQVLFNQDFFVGYLVIRNITNARIIKVIFK